MSENADDIAKKLAGDPKFLSGVIASMARDGAYMRGVLEGIAAQKLSEEHEQGSDEGDYVAGYDAVVRMARTAVGKLCDLNG